MVVLNKIVAHSSTINKKSKSFLSYYDRFDFWIFFGNIGNSSIKRKCLLAVKASW